MADIVLNNKSATVELEIDEAFACTQLGVKGAPIFFKIKELALEYKKLTQDQVMLKLAALVLHEHIHHFQDPSLNFRENEDKANLASGYFLDHSRINKSRLFEWTVLINTSNGDKPLGIIRFYDEKDRDGVFIQIIKDRNYQLKFEICLPKDMQCSPIVEDKSINILEAWLYGENLSSQNMIHVSQGAALISLFTYGLAVAASYPLAGVIARVESISNPQSLDKLPALTEKLATYVGIDLNAALAFWWSSWITDSDLRPSQLLAKFYGKPQNEDETVIIDIVQDIPIINFTEEVKKFVYAVPKLNNVSHSALKQWNDDK
jgi:hypothetical protein